MKPTIIAIVGSSGSGKTYMSKLLQNELNVYSIVSSTTRPKREDETNGVEYYFVKNKPYIPSSEILTATSFGDYDYYALRDQVPPTQICSYIVDEGGVETLKRVHGHRFEIVTVSVQSKPETLVERGICHLRIERDNNRTQLPDSFFDFIIHNDGSLEEFESDIRQTYKILKEWLHRK